MKMSKYLDFLKNYISGAHLHNLCVNDKPVIYVLHLLRSNTYTKFQEIPMLNLGVLIEKLNFGQIFGAKN